jgi:hypothetical protein
MKRNQTNDNCRANASYQLHEESRYLAEERVEIRELAAIIKFNLIITVTNNQQRHI